MFNAHGKTISLYLMDNDPNGRIKCEVSNWSGVSYRIPRNKVKDCAKRKDLENPAVYFLFGRAETTTSKPQVYIGETQEVYKRLVQHRSKRDFWNEAVVFMRKDQNLNKGHVKYLENRIHSICHSVDRYDLKNENKPSLPQVSEQIKAELDEYIEYIKVLTSLFGHKLLQPIIPVDIPLKECTEDISFIHSKKTLKSILRKESPNKHSSKLLTEIQEQHSDYAIYDHFFIKVSGEVLAKGILCDDGFMILEGSTVTLKTQASCPNTICSLRDELVKVGILTKRNDVYAFEEDYLFSSPSTAAKVIMGRNVNGLEVWKTFNGDSIAKIEEKQTSF